MQGVHPVFGGYAIWAKKNGPIIVQVVDVGAAHGKAGQVWDKRYQLKSRPGVHSEVELIVGRRNFLALKSKKEPGASENDRVSIMVVPEKGATVKVSQWGNNRDLGFDQLYEYLRRICRETEGQQKPIHEGVYDPEWRPAGFARPW